MANKDEQEADSVVPEVKDVEALMAVIHKDDDLMY